ncbi:hypothetical protein FDP41_002045 [Naegleria fowleri]|uniref:non-specific serine/threonine protein kinase n=1 Tax=Naegleria fowleri TaxID=5763 RepID=A0A6A5C0B2_NAEFO|nr:uncharacterized protein FDP41_002045 [Naegleria fowleri]KAF0978975.1 hypothetical protein FDP41_002045 [Naegleria fowleri]
MALYDSRSVKNLEKCINMNPPESSSSCSTENQIDNIGFQNYSSPQQQPLNVNNNNTSALVFKAMNRTESTQCSTTHSSQPSLMSQGTTTTTTSILKSSPPHSTSHPPPVMSSSQQQLSSPPFLHRRTQSEFISGSGVHHHHPNDHDIQEGNLIATTTTTNETTIKTTTQGLISEKNDKASNFKKNHVKVHDDPSVTMTTTTATTEPTFNQIFNPILQVDPIQPQTNLSTTQISKFPTEPQGVDIPNNMNSTNNTTNNNNNTSSNYHIRTTPPPPPKSKYRKKHFSLFEMNSPSMMIQQHVHLTPSSLIFYTPTTRKRLGHVEEFSKNDHDNVKAALSREDSMTTFKENTFKDDGITSSSNSSRSITSSHFIMDPINSNWQHTSSTLEKSPFTPPLNGIKHRTTTQPQVTHSSHHDVYHHYTLEEFPLPDFSNVKKHNHITFDQFNSSIHSSSTTQVLPNATMANHELSSLSQQSSPLPSVSDLLASQESSKEKENTVVIGPYTVFIDSEYSLSASSVLDGIFSIHDDTGLDSRVPKGALSSEKYFYEGFNTTTNEKVNVISKLVDSNYVEAYREKSKKLLLLDNHVTGIIQLLDVAEIQLKNSIHEEESEINQSSSSSAGSIFYIFVEPCLLMHKIIQKTKIEEKKFSYPILLEWLSQLADGLANIHEHLSTVHGNINVNSIFYSKNEECMKIGNMLLLTPEISKRRLSEPKSPFPESLNDFNFSTYRSNTSFTPLDLGKEKPRYDMKTEVWLFGILTITIITMKNMNVIMNSFIDNDQSFVSSLFQIISKQYNDRFCALIWRACHSDPSYRPTMRELCYQLGLLKKYRSISGSTSSTRNSIIESDVNQYQKHLDDIRVNMELGSILGDLYGVEEGQVSEQKLHSRNSNSYDILPLCTSDGPAVLSSLISIGRTIMRFVNKHYKIKDKKKKKNKLMVMKNKIKKLTKQEKIDADSRRLSKKTLEEELQLGNHTRVFEHQEEVDLKIMQTKIESQYRIISIIGSGSQGTVIKAFDIKNNRHVAIKRIRMKDNNDTLLAAKEISSMFSLSECENICKIYHWFIYCENREDKKNMDQQASPNLYESEEEDTEAEDDEDDDDEYDFKDYANETWYISIVIEYCSEGDLRKALRYCRDTNTYFKNSVVKNWLTQLVTAVDYIHRKNLMHRDISLKNIFLHSIVDQNMLQESSYFDHCIVKLGDMGLSIKLEELNGKNAQWGTRRTMAPEQRLGKRYDCSVDIWSMGCIALEMISQYNLSSKKGGDRSLDDLRHVDYYSEIKNNPNYLNEVLKPLEHYYDDHIIQFIKSCIVIEPWKRATTQQLFNLLHQDIRSVENVEMHFDESLEEFRPSPFPSIKHESVTMMNHPHHYQQQHDDDHRHSNNNSNNLNSNLGLLNHSSKLSTMVSHASLSNFALLKTEMKGDPIEENTSQRRLSGNPVFIELENSNRKYVKPEPKGQNSGRSCASLSVLDSKDVLTSYSLSMFFKEIEFEEKHEKETRTNESLSNGDHHSSLITMNNICDTSSLPEEFSSQVKKGHENNLHKLLQKPIMEWTTSDVGIWLISIDFSKFVENFQSQNITGKALLLIREEDLKDVGCVKVGDKLLLWNMIQNLKQLNEKRSKKK